jgi:asparagine synthase (glutamine-hydrolysing)
MPRDLRHRLPGQKLHRIGGMMAQQGESAMYRSLVSAWQDPLLVVRRAREPEDAVAHAMRAHPSLGMLNRMLLADQSSYLTEDQMTKVDRASMAVGLEVRVPILDHRVVEFAWRIPESMKIRGGVGKWILRQVLYRYVPRALVEREKMGFSIPLGPWLRGPLRGWAGSLLERRRLVQGGILEPAPVSAVWQRVLAGDDQGALGIWAILMFEQWKDKWLA